MRCRFSAGLLLIVSFVGVQTARAQVSNVQVLGSSNTQTLLSYRAPSAQSCSVAISEKQDLSTLVIDVNPSLFPDADLDSRPGGVFDGLNRIFLAGARAVDEAVDGKWYSRALQADTQHYYRIQCGDSSASGSFRTATVPWNSGPGWPIPQDPSTGDFRWPSTDNGDRTQSIVDPNYGTLIRRVSVPGDNPGEVDVKKGRFNKAYGAQWTNAASALAGDGTAAVSTGQGWLALTDARVQIGTAYYLLSQSITSVVVRITGSASGVQRVVEACLTIDGVACVGEIRAVSLAPGVSTVTIGSATPVDTWGALLWQQDVTGNVNFGVLLRAAPGTVASIDSVDFDLVTNQTMGYVSSGSFSVCQKTLSNGGYRCILPGSGGGGANWLYWIQPSTGETRFLGIMLATGWGGSSIYCRENNALWDAGIPNVSYCAGYSSGTPVILRGQYTGGDRSVAPGSLAPISWTNLTPQNALADRIRAFDGSVDPSAFQCTLETAIGTRLVLSCTVAGQDSLGFVAAFDTVSGQIVALFRMYNSAAARWCGIHSVEPLGGIDWIGITPHQLAGTYAVTLTSPLLPTATATVQVSGDPPFQPAQTGDVFFVETTGELVRITAKTSANQWTVERKNPLAAIPAGVRLLASCSVYYQESNGAPQIYWNPVADPKAADTSGRTIVVERVTSGSHILNRGSYRIVPDWQRGFNVLTSPITESFNRQPDYSIPVNPRFNGTRGEGGVGQNYDGLGDGYETHPSYENFAAASPAARSWFADLHPFIGSPQFGASLARSPGTLTTYKISVPPLQRDLFPAFARCGGRQLKEIAGPISDQQPYTFCAGAKCRPEARESDVYLSCPAPVTPESTCYRNFFGDPATACAGPVLGATQSIVQYFLDASGTQTRTLTNGLAAWHSDRTFRILDTPSTLPDGSWILFPSFANNARRDYYMVKVPAPPAAPPQNPERSQTVRVKIDVPAGAIPVRVDYGPTPSAGAALSDIDCAQGCTAVLPGASGQALFYQTLFRDASGALVRGAVSAAFVNGTVGNGLPPTFGADSLVNSASLDRQLAPGALATLFGEHLADCDASAVAFPLPTQLCGASVSVNGHSAPLFFAGAGQINFLMPATIPPLQDFSVSVSRDGISSASLTIPGSFLSKVAPAIFSYQFTGEPMRAALVSPDGVLNGPAGGAVVRRPLKRGEPGVLFANGFGNTNPSVPDGQQTPATPFSYPVTPVQVMVNGVQQKVLFAGLTPLGAAYSQVNFVLDPATPFLGAGNDKIWIQQGDRESPKLVLAIDPQ